MAARFQSERRQKRWNRGKQSRPTCCERQLWTGYRFSNLRITTGSSGRGLVVILRQPGGWFKISYPPFAPVQTSQPLCLLMAGCCGTPMAGLEQPNFKGSFLATNLRRSPTPRCPNRTWRLFHAARSQTRTSRRRHVLLLFTTDAEDHYVTYPI